jgi:D-alanyl-D-alanine dipeptidase
VNRRFVLALLPLAACAAKQQAPVGPPGPPPDPPVALRPFVGDYAAGADTFSVLEDAGILRLQRWRGESSTLAATSDSTFEAVAPAGGPAPALTFRRGADGRVTGLTLGGRTLERLRFAPEDGSSFRITPVRPTAELAREALAATPPREEGDFLPSDLVELVTLDSTIKLDVRYATSNNFVGEPFYSEPRAFLPRPAAEALVRAHRWLKERGYGLLVHDGYRPWYVTKMFWDATPQNLKVFVANPAQGSRHNRGCAVDLTLYELATGAPVVMTGGYDEMSPRSYPDYPGGTARQRWHRELLRQAMEAQGFTVYEAEWWHFDYQDWRRYRVGNERFEEIGGR